MQKPDPGRLLNSIRIVVVLLCCTLTACFYSKYPISNPTTIGPDHPLLGKWNLNDPDKNGSAQVLHKGDHFTLVLEETNAKNQTKTESFELIPTSLDSKEYLNIKIPNNEGFDYFICEYQILEDETLIVRYPDEAFVMQAIKNKEIAGKTRKNTLLPSTFLYASQVSLKSFISRYSDKLFPEDTFTLKLKRAE